mmetsp:Transcript_1465/g.2438  ORF Transcript_1465/g.2438 Transcript_1465/m.2438 type:complete len:117 (-) Transcript_1465:330-680(-)
MGPNSSSALFESSSGLLVFVSTTNLTKLEEENACGERRFVSFDDVMGLCDSAGAQQIESSSSSVDLSSKDEPGRTVQKPTGDLDELLDELLSLEEEEYSEVERLRPNNPFSLMSMF